MHDQTASVMSMVRQLRSSLDIKQAQHTMPTAQLCLILDTFIGEYDAASKPSQEVDTAAQKHVLGTIGDLVAKQRDIAEAVSRQRKDG